MPSLVFTLSTLELGRCVKHTHLESIVFTGWLVMCAAADRRCVLKRTRPLRDSHCDLATSSQSAPRPHSLQLRPAGSAVEMGDDEALDYFEVEEAVLLAGGGGGYEENVDDDDEEEEGGGLIQIEGQHEEMVEEEEEGGEEEKEEEGAKETTEDQRKSQKKRSQIDQLKQRKRQRVAEGEVEKVAAATMVARPQLTAEEQFRIFMQHQPKTAAGSLLASFLPSDFFYPVPSSVPLEEKKKKKPGNGKSISLLCAIEAGMGGDFRKRLAQPSDEMGCPVVIILCSSARRAAEVIKQISPKLHCHIAKLFAKHFKVTEQVELLTKQHFPVAVGTPNRVAKLLELGALCLKSTDLLLVDMALDTKQFTILNLPGVSEDFYTLAGGYVQNKAHIKTALVR